MANPVRVLSVMLSKNDDQDINRLFSHLVERGVVSTRREMFMGILNVIISMYRNNRLAEGVVAEASGRAHVGDCETIITIPVTQDDFDQLGIIMSWLSLQTRAQLMRGVTRVVLDLHKSGKLSERDYQVLGQACEVRCESGPMTDADLYCSIMVDRFGVSIDAVQLEPFICDLVAWHVHALRVAQAAGLTVDQEVVTEILVEMNIASMRRRGDEFDEEDYRNGKPQLCAQNFARHLLAELAK
jgi:hypothetical protein